MSSIGPREDSNRLGNVSKKWHFFWWIFENLRFFWRWSQINLEPFQGQKNNTLTQTSMILNKMVRSTLPHLHLWTGLRLNLWVPALLRDFDPLTPYFWQKYLTDQEILRSYFRTMLELGACLIWARLDHGKTCSGQEICHKKCQNFDENLKIWRFSEDDLRSTWKRSKTKKTAF